VTKATGEGVSPLPALVEECQSILMSLARLGIQVDSSLGMQVEAATLVEFLFKEDGPLAGRYEEYQLQATERLLAELKELQAQAGKQRLHVPGMPPMSHIR
jgi:hypothetical protein